MIYQEQESYFFKEGNKMGKNADQSNLKHLIFFNIYLKTKLQVLLITAFLLKMQLISLSARSSVDLATFQRNNRRIF